MDERLAAATAYERAVFGGDPGGLGEADRTLDALEADLVLARGRLRHAAWLANPTGGRPDPAQELDLFERAVALYAALGDGRGEAEALFWVAAYHQVVAGDATAAAPYLERSLRLARQADDRMTAAYALRHLGIAAHRAGRLAEARARLEESTELRRALGFRPGVAANLVGLAYLAGAEQRSDDALGHLAEAETLAVASGAYGVLADVREARAALVEVTP